MKKLLYAAQFCLLWSITNTLSADRKSDFVAGLKHGFYASFCLNMNTHWVKNITDLWSRKRLLSGEDKHLGELVARGISMAILFSIMVMPKPRMGFMPLFLTAFSLYCFVNAIGADYADAKGIGIKRIEFVSSQENK